MADWRDQLGDAPPTLSTGSKFFIRRITSPVWASIPALVVPQPILRVQDNPDAADVHFGTMAYTVLTIDVEYVAREVLPALAARHFAAGGNGFDYQVAVLSRPGDGQHFLHGPRDFATEFFNNRLCSFVDVLRLIVKEIH